MQSLKNGLTLRGVRGVLVTFSAKYGSKYLALSQFEVPDGRWRPQAFVTKWAEACVEGKFSLLLPDDPKAKERLPEGVTENPHTLIPTLLTPRSQWPEGQAEVVRDLLTSISVVSEVRSVDWPTKGLAAGQEVEFYIDNRLFWKDHVEQIVVLPSL